MFRVLVAGVWPKVDHTGSPFPAKSWRAGQAKQHSALRVAGACIGKTGDWQLYKSVLGLRGWRPEGPSKSLCWVCNAGFGEDVACYDFKTTAGWRQTIVTQADFWAEAHRERKYLSAVWKIPGFHLSLIAIDWMHCVDLGVLQYCMGNCMWEVFVELGGGHCGSPKLQSVSFKASSKWSPAGSGSITPSPPSLSRCSEQRLRRSPSSNSKQLKADTFCHCCERFWRHASLLCQHMKSFDFIVWKRCAAVLLSLTVWIMHLRRSDC